MSEVDVTAALLNHEAQIEAFKELSDEGQGLDGNEPVCNLWIVFFGGNHASRGWRMMTYDYLRVHALRRINLILDSLFKKTKEIG